MPHLISVITHLHNASSTRGPVVEWFIFIVLYRSPVMKIEIIEMTIKTVSFHLILRRSLIRILKSAKYASTVFMRD